MITVCVDFSCSDEMTLSLESEIVRVQNIVMSQPQNSSVRIPVTAWPTFWNSLKCFLVCVYLEYQSNSQNYQEARK